MAGQNHLVRLEQLRQGHLPIACTRTRCAQGARGVICDEAVVTHEGLCEARCLAACMPTSKCSTAVASFGAGLLGLPTFALPRILLCLQLCKLDDLGDDAKVILGVGLV